MPTRTVEGRPPRLSVPELLVQRIKAGYTQENPTDNLDITLNLQGGGLAAVRVAAKTVACNDLGILQVVDTIDPISASNPTIVATLGGDARKNMRHFLTPNYLDRWGLFKGKKNN